MQQITYGYIDGSIAKHHKQHLVKLCIRKNTVVNNKELKIAGIVIVEADLFATSHAYTICNRKLINPTIREYIIRDIDICHYCRVTLWKAIITGEEWADEPKMKFENESEISWLLEENIEMIVLFDDLRNLYVARGGTIEEWVNHQKSRRWV